MMQAMEEYRSDSQNNLDDLFVDGLHLTQAVSRSPTTAKGLLFY